MMYKASEIAVMLGVSGHIANGDVAIDSLLTDSRSLRAGGGSLFSRYRQVAATAIIL